MARKPKDKEAAADFFGEEDDLGWLDDGEEESADPPARPAPVPPPPPPPFQTNAKTTVPLDAPALVAGGPTDGVIPAADGSSESPVAPRPRRRGGAGEPASDWDPRVTDAPSGPNPLANAETVILPKTVQKPTGRTPAAEPPRIVVPVSPPPGPDEVVARDAQPSVPPAPDVVEGAGLHAPAQVNVPGQPTPGPSLERARIGPDGSRQSPTSAPRAEGPRASLRAESAQVSPRAEPPRVSPRAEPPRVSPRAEPPRVQRKPATPVPAFVPREGAQAWTEVAHILSSEAEAHSGAERAVLLAAAARVALDRVGNPELARDLMSTSLAADGTRADDHLLYARIAHALDWHEEEERALRAAADASAGTDRVHAAFAASRLASRRGDVDAAVSHLRVAAAGDPRDYHSRLLLLELLPENETEERLRIATEAAALANGAIAADHHVTRARIEEQRGQNDEARAAYQAALAAAPDHAEAFQGLEALASSGPEIRAGLYESRAERAGRSTSEAGWWWFEAGRAWAAAGRDDRAAASWTAAHEAGALEAGPALEAAALVGAGNSREVLLEKDWSAGGGSPAARAQTGFRLATLRERVGDVAGALELYREVLRLDPHAAPALGAARRLLADRPAEEAEVLRTFAGASPDAALVLAERAELDGDIGAARTAYASAVRAEGVTRTIAFDGLDRVLAHLGDEAALRDVRAARAAATADPAERSAWWLLAAHPVPPKDEAAALAPLRAALDARPADLVLLAAATPPLERAGAWRELASRWQAAADVSDATRRGLALDRAARLLRDRLDQPDEAAAAAANAVAAEPGLALRWALGGPRELAALATDPAERWWYRFAAGVTEDGAEARDDLELVLAEDPGHVGARRALEVVLASEGDTPGLAALYTTGATESAGVRRAWQACRAALLLIEAGRDDEAVALLERVPGLADQSDDGPLRVAARLALRLDAGDLAAEILSGSDDDADQAERARLLTDAGHAAEAFPILLALTEDDTGPGLDAVAVAAQAAAAARRSGDAVSAARLVEIVAAHAPSAAVRAAYAALGADAPTWQPPGPTSADPNTEAEALETAPGAEPARRLADLLIAARLREEAGAWREAGADHAVWRELALDPRVRLGADARRRWLLTEKLAGTDEAWELFKTLHDDAPDDREVTETLARIAESRGEGALAVRYLGELASSATDPAEATRTRVHIARLHEGAGEAASARQAYLDALDHTPDAQDAVDGLRRVAVGEHDWPALVAVLQREAGSAPRDRAIELRAEIARVTETQIVDLPVAMDQWRSVLELDPLHEEALRHLVALSEQLGEWGTFVETGEQLVPLLHAADRGALLRKIGIACQDQLGREDAARFFQEAVAGELPDLEAARRLEGHARTRGDWPQVVRALELQAAADPDAEGRRSAWFRAARIQVETLEDRAGAAASYRRILDLNPDDDEALRFVGQHLFEQGRTAEALEICERLDPVVEKGQDLEDFDTRIELSGFYFMFAEMLVQRGDIDGALARYERALELNPTHLQTLEAVAPLYTDRKDWAKAERVYRQLLQLSGGQGDKQRIAATYTALGLVERELGATDKAYRRFGKALELHPHNVGALKGMALVLEDREDWSNVLNVYNNIIYHATLPADVIDAYMTKGRILDDHMERVDKAAQHYQRSLDFDPDQPDAWLRLAELALRRSAWVEAAEHADKGLALASHVVGPYETRLLLLRAAAWHAAGRTDDALASLRRATEGDPRLASALGERPLDDLDGLRLKVRELTANS